MVTIDLITGFLGAGKTTFLLKYCAYLKRQGEKIGILEYDYGAVNVDMLLLNKLRDSNCELEMVAAACDEDCLRRRFKTKLIAMAMSGYTRVIVEPSGVFDMDMFYDALREDPLERFYEIGNVITIVNAGISNRLDDESLFYLASQAACAGCVVLSRTQLYDEEIIGDTKKYIIMAAEKIKSNKIPNMFFEKNWDELDDEDFSKLSSCAYRVADYVKVTAGADTNYNSVCFLEIPYSLEELKTRIAELFESDAFGKIVRVKGFICEKDGSYQINATQYELSVSPIAIGQEVLIVIGTQMNVDRVKQLFT